MRTSGIIVILMIVLGTAPAGQLPENLFATPSSEKSWAVVIGISSYQFLVIGP